MYSAIKRKVYLLLDPTDGGTVFDRLINAFIVSLIVLNVLAVILETIDDVYIAYKFLFNQFEAFSIFVFTIEYILRVWICTTKLQYSHPVKGRIRYVFSTSALIDLVAILPFYLPLLALDFRFIRLLRLLRFSRFFKLGRYFKASKTLKKVFVAKREELVLSLFVVLILIVMASCVMYFAEHGAQPDKFSSIPETMWWSVATLTTIGYGDVYPITAMGKLLAACVAILGIGMFALPAGILASGFSDELKKSKQTIVCPNCGHQHE